MGASASVDNSDTALRLCRDRMRYIKQAVDARNALSAAQLSYEQSLRSLAASLTRFVEAEMSGDVSRSPSHTSYTPLPRSPLIEHCSASPQKHQNAAVSYVKSTTSPSVEVTMDSTRSLLIREEHMLSPVLPPPPPPPDIFSSWDFFNAVESSDGVAEQTVEHSPKTPEITLARSASSTPGGNNYHTPVWNEKCSIAPSKGDEQRSIAAPKPSCSGADVLSLEKEWRTKKEDPSEFVTHRAEDMLSSIKDVEHQFIRAAGSCHEVSRMLETRKIQLNVSSLTIGKSSELIFLSAFLICCKARTADLKESDQQVARVITWNRSVSSRSSFSSRNPLVPQASNDDRSESGSEFTEEFSMISGSHSSTLDRLYAWERKLNDELKATDLLRQTYDQKCRQLRYQFAQDMDARVIDRTRAVIKDLRSRLLVATRALDSISRRIEKLRDEELHPQLMELVQGLARMWSGMLENHHAQQITVSLAYRVNAAAPAKLPSERVVNLRSEIECIRSSLANWLDAHKCYAEALNFWLQKCVLPTQERSRGRRGCSPRRYVSPPIFGLLQAWSARAATPLGSEAQEAMTMLARDLNENCKLQHRSEGRRTKKTPSEFGDEGNDSGTEVAKSLQAGLAAMFKRLTGLSEAMVRMYEDVKQEGERAHAAYAGAGVR